MKTNKQERGEHAAPRIYSRMGQGLVVFTITRTYACLEQFWLPPSIIFLSSSRLHSLNLESVSFPLKVPPLLSSLHMHKRPEHSTIQFLAMGAVLLLKFEILASRVPKEVRQRGPSTHFVRFKIHDFRSASGIQTRMDLLTLCLLNRRFHCHLVYQRQIGLFGAHSCDAYPYIALIPPLKRAQLACNITGKIRGRIFGTTFLLSGRAPTCLARGALMRLQPVRWLGSLAAEYAPHLPLTGF